MTEEQIAELEKLASAATPRPWAVRECTYAVHQPEFECWIPAGPDDAAYIVAACNAVPELLATIARLVAEKVTPWGVGDLLWYDMGHGSRVRCTYRGDCEGWPLVTFDADGGTEQPIHVRPSRLSSRAKDQSQ